MTSPVAVREPHCPLESLLGAIGEAVEAEEVEAICRGVKAELERRIGERQDFLPKWALEPRADGYARHLVHRDPQGRFSAIVMVWSPGQGTPIHDHGGLWCVECVYQGKIRVRSYDLEETRDDGAVRFVENDEVTAGCGEAGHLIPPFDHHVIDNPFERVAATLHVYGGDMSACQTFQPLGDGFHREQERKLSYDD